MRNLMLKISTLLLAGTALSACSAVDRLHNIGEAPQMAKVGNPAGQTIVAEIRAPRPSPISTIRCGSRAPRASSMIPAPCISAT